MILCWTNVTYIVLAFPFGERGGLANVVAEDGSSVVFEAGKQLVLPAGRIVGR